VFALLFAINVVNYLDRILAVAVGPALKTQFHLSDFDIGLLASAFLLIYTLASLPLGLLADRVARTRVVAVGLAVWSLMSAATGFARGIGGLFLTRAGVGVGEASYAPAGTALLGAYYPREQRAKVFSRWGSGQIVGTALAFLLIGGLDRWLGSTQAWRVAFWITAVPGVVLAVLMWRVRDQSTAAPTWARPSALVAFSTAGGWRAACADAIMRIKQVLSIRTVLFAIALQALTYVVVTPTITFLPIYVRSPRAGLHLATVQASLVSGSVIVVGGMTGYLLGGRVADWLTSHHFHGARPLTICLGAAVAAPCYIIMVLVHSMPIFLIFGTLAVIAMTIPVGPLNAIIQDTVPNGLRASSVAIVTVAGHVLGDAWAPTAVGRVSTALGEHTGIGLVCIGAPALVIAALVAWRARDTYDADVVGRNAADGADANGAGN
jgi:MFS family permease